MHVLFLVRYYYPHIGGVEKHVAKIAKNLISKGITVTVVTEKYDKDLPGKEVIDGVKVIRFFYPKIRFIGLLYIWFWSLININLFRKVSLIHAHDVSIWYLPLRIILPNKPFYSTFHGWEGKFPIPYESILVRRLSAMISDKFICVGGYQRKYFTINANLVIYGAVDSIPRNVRKTRNTVVFLGRLEPDTGIPEFLQWLKKNRNLKADFCGDGSLREKCEKYGGVYGFVDPTPFLKKSEYCVPGGYLSALEAMSFKCKVKVFWGNPVKKDIWQMTPFYSWVKKYDTKSAFDWIKLQTWKKLSYDYLKLWSVQI